MHKESWSMEAVWVPVFIPARLPQNNERWSPLTQIAGQVKDYPVEILTTDAQLPSRNLASGSPAVCAFRKPASWTGASTCLPATIPGRSSRPPRMIIAPVNGQLVIDPGAAAEFHKMSSVGMDAAFVKGDLEHPGGSSPTRSAAISIPTSNCGAIRPRPCWASLP